MPNSPSTSKEVPAGITHVSPTMQSIVPFLMALSLVSATPLTLLPYAYLSAPLPVSQHFQDTRTGVHAYSYAGGPSAKEEIKDADGVRGSYSYIDANGILQSVFYVADDNGFRVAATNLPTDDNLEADEAHIILARNAEGQKSSRRRRSVQESAQNPDQVQQDTKDTADQGISSDPDQKSTPITLSEQNGSQIKSEEKQPILTRSLLQPAILSADIPLATSHQSQVQVHNSERIDLARAGDKDKPIERQWILSAPAILESLPLLPSYHENRIQLHKQLGIEGARPKDAVKIDPEPITVLPTSSSVAVPLASSVIAKESVPILPVVANEPLPVIPAARLGTSSVTTTISSHGISQVHGPSRQAVAVPNLIAKAAVPVVAATRDVPIAGSLVADERDLGTATVTTSISSHGVSQIHGNSNIEPALLVRTTPIAQLHSFVPVYLR